MLYSFLEINFEQDFCIPSFTALIAFFVRILRGGSDIFLSYTEEVSLHLSILGTQTFGNTKYMESLNKMPFGSTPNLFIAIITILF